MVKKIIDVIDAIRTSIEGLCNVDFFESENS